MEDIFEMIVKAILRIIKVAFRVFVEIFLQGIFEIFIEKCYKNYPKTTILIIILFLALIVFALFYF